jgi:hypothetical protein
MAAAKVLCLEFTDNFRVKRGVGFMVCTFWNVTCYCERSVKLLIILIFFLAMITIYGKGLSYGPGTQLRTTSSTTETIYPTML